MRTGSESEHDFDGVVATVDTAGDGTPGEASPDQVSLGDATPGDGVAGDGVAIAGETGDGGALDDDAHHGAAHDGAAGDPPATQASPVAPMQRRFRLPKADDPAPASNKLLGLCIWAAALGLIGLIPGGRLAVAVVLDTGPSWYSPVALALGMLGMAAVAAGFAAIHLARLPWQLLGFASFLLLLNLILIYTAL